MLFALLVYMMTSGDAAHAADMPMLDQAECQYLSEYQQEEGVEYKPGRDVHGKPVVEADISQSPMMPEKFTLDVTVDTAKYLGLAVPAGVETTGKIGTITFEKGKILFNDKPMEGDSVTALKALCKSKPALQNGKKVNYNQ